MNNKLRTAATVVLVALACVTASFAFQKDNDLLWVGALLLLALSYLPRFLKKPQEEN